jgi:hypothetical protein
MTLILQMIADFFLWNADDADLADGRRFIPARIFQTYHLAQAYKCPKKHLLNGLSCKIRVFPRSITL